jgi:hypothetical protein
MSQVSNIERSNHIIPISWTHSRAEVLRNSAHTQYNASRAAAEVEGFKQ